MSTRTLFLDRGLGEDRGVVLLDGRPERLLIAREGEAAAIQVGARLAKGESMEQIVGAMNQVAEGIKTTRAVHEYGQANGLYLPITEGVHRILYDGVPPRAVLAELMESTRFTYEIDPELPVE